MHPIAAQQHPDLILVDLSQRTAFKPFSGLRLAAPNAKLLALVAAPSTPGIQRLTRQADDLGLSGLVYRSDGSQPLLQTVRQALAA